MTHTNFLTNINLNQNELQNVVIQPLATAPSNPKTGQIYYNTTNSVLYSWDGSQWSAVGTTYVLPPATDSTLGGVIVSTGLSVDSSGNLTIDTVPWSAVTSTPTTIAGYAISDAKIDNGVITLGSATITPVVDANYVHTDNNFTSTLKDKLDAIASGAEVNVIDTVKVNGSALTPVSKAVDISVPTGSSTSPKMDGTATVGTETSWAHGDHIHPTDTSRAPLASPAFTGTPTAPTADNGTNNTQIATTAFVHNTLAYADAMRFKGTIGTGGTISSLPNTHKAGWTYKVITAGTYAGQTAEIGDLIVCVKDGTAASNDDWTVVQTNIDGAVTGPASSTSGHIPTFNGTSGKVIQDGYGVASSITNDSTTIPTTAAVNTAVTGLIKTATGTIGTSATTTTVNTASGATVLSAYATMSSAIIGLDITINSANVVFTCAQSPSSAVTCTVIYI